MLGAKALVAFAPMTKNSDQFDTKYNFKKMTNFAEKNLGTYKLFVVPYIDFHFCPYSQLQKFSWLEQNFSTDRINSNHQ